MKLFSNRLDTNINYLIVIFLLISSVLNIYFDPIYARLQSFSNRWIWWCLLCYNVAAFYCHQQRVYHAFLVLAYNHTFSDTIVILPTPLYFMFPKVASLLCYCFFKLHKRIWHNVHAFWNIPDKNKQTWCAQYINIALHETFTDIALTWCGESPLSKDVATFTGIPRNMAIAIKSYKLLIDWILIKYRWIDHQPWMTSMCSATLTRHKREPVQQKYINKLIILRLRNIYNINWPASIHRTKTYMLVTSVG